MWLTAEVSSHAHGSTDSVGTGVQSLKEGKLSRTHWKGSQTSVRSSKKGRKWLVDPKSSPLWWVLHVLICVLYDVNVISVQTQGRPQSAQSSNASFQSLEISRKTIERLSMLQNYTQASPSHQSYYSISQSSQRSTTQSYLWDTECKNLSRNHSRVFFLRESRAQNVTTLA